VASGRATWHRCSGRDAHPAHREEHRRGFWTEGHRPIAFIEAHCVYPDGPRVGEKVGRTGTLDAEGRPNGMLPWQREATFEAFRLRDDGHRRYRRVLVGVAKKNSKTVWAGWLALYVLFDNLQRTGQIPCAAASEDQADLVFGHAKQTCQLSASLNQLTGGEGRSSTRFDAEIQVPSQQGKALKRVAVGGGNLDGRNIVFVVLDELHEWKTPKSQETYTVLLRGTVLNPDSIVFMITTAGFDEDTIEGRMYAHGKAVERGEAVDPSFLFIWYEAPEGCDLRDRAAWSQANPSASAPGYPLTFERYLEELDDPETTEAVARRYLLNQHTDVEELWLPEGITWDSLEHRGPDGEPEPFSVRPANKRLGIRTVCSIDAATNVDSTAIAWWEAVGAGDELRVRGKVRVWERPLDPMTGRPVAPDKWTLPQHEVKAHLYAMWFGTDGRDWWAKDGLCACGCEEAFRPMGFIKIGADPARITWGLESWRQDGLPIQEIPQTDQRAVRGFQAWYALLATRRYEHDGSAALARHVRNSSVRFAASGGQRIDRKGGSVRKPNDSVPPQWMNAYLLLEPEEAEVVPQVFI
jgi:hypothetical protein